MGKFVSVDFAESLSHGQSMPRYSITSEGWLGWVRLLGLGDHHNRIRLKPVLLDRLHRDDKRIALDQRLHLIVGEGKLHVEAVSRGGNLRAVEERAEVRVGVSDLIFAVHESGLEQRGKRVGVVGGTADGFECRVDAAASLDADRHGFKFGSELRGGGELSGFRHELLHGEARVRRIQHGPDGSAAVGLN